MLDRIINSDGFSERTAAGYIKTICSAVAYMHSLDLVHRDIKAQNMVFSEHGPDGVLQLIDFGDSKLIKDDGVYNEFGSFLLYVVTI